MKIKITFLGAARGVTGSRFLVDINDFKLLVDCGLFQERNLLGRNWEPFHFPPADIDAVLLTHAHIDHSGYLPKLVREGFNKHIFCTSATADITKVMLLDTAKIQEQDAEHKKKRHQREGRRGPYPEIPLYTTEDATACFSLFSPLPYRQRVKLSENIEFTMYDAGHVLGAAMIELHVKLNGEERVLLFSGDIGRWNRPILCDPTTFRAADYVLTESTYAQRVVPEIETTANEFIGVVNDTLERGGKVIIPSFALERAQDLLYYLSQALDEGEISPIDVYLDSPMAANITEIFTRHTDIFDAETKTRIRQKKSPFDFPGLKLSQTVEESKEIDRVKGPAIIIAGAGMANGGRIKYHLAAGMGKPENTVLFVGYQAVGTLGRIIVDGAEEVRIHGKNYKIRARVEQLHGFSSHADANQLLRWLYTLKRPRHVFIVHGEEHAANYLAGEVRAQQHWEVSVPDYLEEFVLD